MSSKKPEISAMLDHFRRTLEMQKCVFFQLPKNEDPDLVHHEAWFSQGELQSGVIVHIHAIYSVDQTGNHRLRLRSPFAYAPDGHPPADFVELMRSHFSQLGLMKFGIKKMKSAFHSVDLILSVTRADQYDNDTLKTMVFEFINTAVMVAIEMPVHFKLTSTADHLRIVRGH